MILDNSSTIVTMENSSRNLIRSAAPKNNHPAPRQLRGGLHRRTSTGSSDVPRVFYLAMPENLGMIRQYFAERSLKPVGLSVYYESDKSYPRSEYRYIDNVP